MPIKNDILDELYLIHILAKFVVKQVRINVEHPINFSMSPILFSPLLTQA